MCITNYEKTIIIDSNKRSSTDSSSTNFNVRLAQPINCSAVELSDYNIPVTWYNVNSNNNTFKVTISATPYPMTVTGRYNSLISLFEDMKNVMDTDTSQTFTITQGTNGLVTISCTTTFDLSFTSGQLFDLLGLNSGQTLTGKTTYTFEYCPKLYSQEQYLLLKVSYLEGGVEFNNNLQDASSFVIPLPDMFNFGFGNTITNENRQPQQIIFKDPVRLQSFQVSLHDQSNSIIDLNNNDFSVILKIKI